jgi:gamma-glutamylcyclotransferase (GGCT)/AIG2-like uncharacterized protein YtfP
MLFCVNGTLMRGLALNQNMLEVGARFVEETVTAPLYRLWSIGDHYPGMLRVREGGREIAVELWDMEAAGLVRILEREPPGLAIGRVRLADGREMLGVLAEAYLVEGQVEITAFGGWRAYAAGWTPTEDEQNNAHRA